MPSIYGWKGIVLVFTLQFFPFVFLMVSAALNAIDRSLEEAATNLGAGKVRVFFTVTLPVVTPAILSGALVVFYLCIENFGVPVLIGEDYRVLSVQAYNEFISELGGNPAMAGALSMILLAITLALTIFQKYWVERKHYTMTSLNPIQVKRLRPLPTFLIWLFCAGTVFVALFPFAVVMVSSITKTQGPVMYFGQFSLENFIRAFTIAPRPIINSFFLATTATLIGIVFGIVVSYLLVRKRGAVSYLLDLLVMLPLAIAGTVQGIALAATYNKGFIVLTGTWMILVLAYFIRKAPYSIKNDLVAPPADRPIHRGGVHQPRGAAGPLLCPGGAPAHAARHHRRGDHHVGDHPRGTEHHDRPLLRSLGHDDRRDLPADRQRRFRPRLRLRDHPHPLRPDPPLHPQPGLGPGPGFVIVAPFRGDCLPSALETV